MKPELRERILAHNRAVKQNKEKAADLENLVKKLLERLPSTLRKLLPNEVLEILKKYGYEGDT